MMPPTQAPWWPRRAEQGRPLFSRRSQLQEHGDGVGHTGRKRSCPQPEARWPPRRPASGSVHSTSAGGGPGRLAGSPAVRGAPDGLTASPPSLPAGPNHVSMQQTAQSTLPTTSMSMSGSGHGSGPGYSHSGPASQSVPLQGQGAISNYVSRANINMQSNAGNAPSGPGPLRSVQGTHGPPSCWALGRCQGRRLSPGGRSPGASPGPRLVGTGQTGPALRGRDSSEQLCRGWSVLC